MHDGDLAEAIFDRLLEGREHFLMRGRPYRTRRLSEEEKFRVAGRVPNRLNHDDRILRKKVTEF